MKVIATDNFSHGTVRNVGDEFVVDNDTAKKLADKGLVKLAAEDGGTPQGTDAGAATGTPGAATGDSKDDTKTVAPITATKAAQVPDNKKAPEPSNKDAGGQSKTK